MRYVAKEAMKEYEEVTKTLEWYADKASSHVGLSYIEIDGGKLAKDTLELITGR